MLFLSNYDMSYCSGKFLRFCWFYIITILDTRFQRAKSQNQNPSGGVDKEKRTLKGYRKVCEGVGVINASKRKSIRFNRWTFVGRSFGFSSVGYLADRIWVLPPDCFALIFSTQIRGNHSILICNQSFIQIIIDMLLFLCRNKFEVVVIQTKDAFCWKYEIENCTIRETIIIAFCFRHNCQF